jgi:energy-coupling factor transporter ATP-binding protein EcfA2
MPDEKPKGRSASKLLVSILIAAAGPTWSLISGFLVEHPIIAAAVLVLYEATAAVLGLVFAVGKALSKLWLERLTFWTDVTIQNTFSRYRRSYFKFLRATHSHVDLRGLTTRGEFVHQIDDVYIDLALDGSAPHSLSPELLNYRKRSGLSSILPSRRWRSPVLEEPSAEAREDLQAVDNGRVVSDVWSFLRACSAANEVLAIVGPPGSGKTTLLKHMSLSLVAPMLSGDPRRNRKSVGRRTPAIIVLRDHKDLFANKPDTADLADILRIELSDVAGKEPPQWIERQLSKGRILVMLDGLDEVATAETRTSISTWIEKQRRKYPQSLFIVTSRPFGYKSSPINSAVVVQLQPFSEGQIERFIHRWYLATSLRSYGEHAKASAQKYAADSANELLHKLQESVHLLELCANPLLLTMVANVHHYRGALPGSRVELYREICSVLLGKRHQARGVDLKMTADQKQSILEQLAFKMMEQPTRDVTFASADEIISAVLARVTKKLTPAEFLKDVEDSSGLLVERESGVYAFAHQTFQEYLAASYVRGKGSGSLLLDKIANSWWREVVLLYAAQADATDIVTECLKFPNSPSAISLAVQCAEEARELDVDLRDQLEQLSVGEISMPGQPNIGGWVAAFRRIRSFVRYSADSYVSVTPASAIELAAFADDTKSMRLLDHTSRLQMDPSPAAGMRTIDALQFVGWLNSVYAQEGSGWIYRLPTENDLLSLTLKAKFDAQNIAAVATFDEISSGESDRASGRLQFKQLGDYSPAAELLDSQMNADYDAAAAMLSDDKESEFLSILDKLDSDYRLTIASLECLSRNTVSRLAIDSRSAMFKKFEKFAGLDLSATISSIERSVQLALGMTREVGGNDSGLGSPDFVQMVQDLGFISACTFNRSMTSGIASSGNKADRLLCRVLAVSAANSCRRSLAAMQTEQAGPLQDDQRKSQSRRNLRILSKSRFKSRDIVTGWIGSVHISLTPEFRLQELISNLESIYISLGVLESRIAGRSDAWEGIMVVRSRR